MGRIVPWFGMPERANLSALSANVACACREHRPILKAAYFNNSSDPLARSKFSLEVTKSESVALCQAFDRKKAAAGGGSRGSQRPQPIPTPTVAPAAQRYVVECRNCAHHLSASLSGPAARKPGLQPCPKCLLIAPIPTFSKHCVKACFCPESCLSLGDRARSHLRLLQTSSSCNLSLSSTIISSTCSSSSTGRGAEAQSSRGPEP